jgi:outer membrane protein TolC
MKGKDPVTMKFPFPGVTALKGEIVDQEVRAKQETLEAVRRDAVTEIRKAFWNLVYLIKAGDITAEMVSLLKYLESVANTRYESGKSNYQDVIKVRINRETLEETLTTLNERQRNVESMIRKVLDLLPSVELGTPAWEWPAHALPDLFSLNEKAQTHRQELRQSRAAIAAMEYMVEMAETMILPPYTLNLSLYPNEPIRSVGSSAQGDSFPVTTRASPGAGLPQKPWYGVEDAYIREIRQNLRARKEDLKNAEAATYTLVRDAWYELDRARREITLYQDKVVRLSRSALDVSTRGYESGNVAFADVIDSYTTWLRANLMLERNRSDLGIGWARLEQVVGVSLH